MIVGIGVDIIEISRVVKSCENEHFKNKIFTKDEIAGFDKNMRRAASSFAAKEAVVKVFGTGFNGIEACEIELLHMKNGAPYIRLNNKAKEKAESMGISKIHISISNTKENVIAYAIGEA